MLKKQDMSNLLNFASKLDKLEIDFELVGPATDTSSYDEVDLVVSGKNVELRRAADRIRSLSEQGEVEVVDFPEKEPDFSNRFLVRVRDTFIDLRLFRTDARGSILRRLLGA